jgi:acetyltransferase-like isoleucine patch superfamily enzyme
MRQRTQRPTAWKKLLGAEPLPWAVCIGARRAFTKAKSKVLSHLFRAPGLHLGPGCVVRGARHIVFGRGVYATGNLWLEAVTAYGAQNFVPRVVIGDNVAFSDGVHITSIEQIIIERNVLMGSRVFISDHNHGSYRGQCQSLPHEPPARRPLGGSGRVTIAENVWIGDNVVILGPANIGASAVIGANSVVRSDVPAQTIVAGAPARVIKRFNPATTSWERV